jgi:hypothetical protein
VSALAFASSDDDELFGTRHPGDVPQSEKRRGFAGFDRKAKEAAQLASEVVVNRRTRGRTTNRFDVRARSLRRPLGECIRSGNDRCQCAPYEECTAGYNTLDRRQPRAHPIPLFRFVPVPSIVGAICRVK